MRSETFRAQPPNSAFPWGKVSRASAAFLVFVILPTIVCGLYYFFFASDRYLVETHFIVRSAKGSDTGGLSSLFRTFGIQRAADESYAVVDYILSRDAVRAIDNRRSLRQIFLKPEADRIARYPRWWAFWRKDDFESLYEYYLDRVEAWYDDYHGGIITLRAVAFTPEDARLLASLLLQQSENLINRMNERANYDAVSFAQKEVARAESMVLDAQKKITEFRNKELILDPVHDSEKALELIAQLTTERAEIQRQLGEILQSSPSSPAIQGLRVRVSALDGQIAAEKSKIVGKDKSLALQIATYERLTLDRQFVDQNLATAFQTLQAAQQNAWRQQVYIEATVSPSLPDESTEPRSTRNVFAVFIISFFLFSLIWLVISASREHAS